MGFETDKINNRRGKRIRWNSEYPLGSLGRDDYKNGESFYFMLGTWLEETEQLTDDDSAELVMRLEHFFYQEIKMPCLNFVISFNCLNSTGSRVVSNFMVQFFFYHFFYSFRSFLFPF